MKAKFNEGDIVKLWSKGHIGEVTKCQALNDGEMGEDGTVYPWFEDYYTVSGYTDGILATHYLTLVCKAENREDRK